MKVLVVDDEKLQLLRLEQTVKSVLKDAEVFSYTNPKEALEGSTKDLIDVAFLDIEMPVINGIQLAKTLKLSNPNINIIFVTAYDSYALEAYKIHASGYISKPVNEERVKAEIENLRHPIQMQSKKRIQAKCFGNFELFCDQEPIKFSYSKSKELLAYLIDREGAAISINELNAVLWEEDHKSYLRNIIVDIRKTLASLGASDVFIKKHNECYIDVNKIDCDSYEFKNNNPNAIRMYRGEYMAQYSWALFNVKDDLYEEEI